MDWAATWRMHFNPTKCYIMHSMTKYQKRTTCAAPYTMGAHTLERVSDSKYLGVTLNENFEWSTHTQMTAGKANTTLSFLECNLWLVPQHLRSTVSLKIMQDGIMFHAPTRTTSSRCFMLHRTVHALCDLYGNPYRNCAEKKKKHSVCWRIGV